MEKIRNINERLGDSVTFDSIEEMAQHVKRLGYMPEDGLKAGRDYVMAFERVTLEKITLKEESDEREKDEAQG